MASSTDVIEALEKFELDLIEKHWSDDIWSKEFTYCPDDISDEFADKFSPLSYCDILQVIEQANKIIHIWLTDCLDTSTPDSPVPLNSSAVTGPSWTLLKNVDYRKLLSVLFYYISKGHKNNQDINSVHICIKATNLYFTLLAIPGSEIYKIFHVTLFEKCLETFSLHKYLEIATGRKIKKAKMEQNEEFSSEDEFFDMDETLTHSQQRNVVQYLNKLLETFQNLVKSFSFKKFPEALNMSLMFLSDLTRLERTSTLHEFSTNDTISSFAPLSRRAYMTMKDICSAFHGRVPEIIRLVLFHLMPNLTSVGGLSNPELNKINQKELTNIRNIALSFISENIITLGEEAHLGLKVLIQQICYNMIDRLDYRTKAIEMVISILCKLPMDVYYSILRWIFWLCVMDGAHHRVIGLEMLSKLIYLKAGSNDLSKLTESQFIHFESQLCNSASETTSKYDSTYNTSLEPIISFSQPVNYVPLEYRRIMFAIILDRIQDEAASVRTRALSILSEIILNRTSYAVQIILRELFIHPYADLSSIDFNNLENENEFLKWKVLVSYLEKIQKTLVGKNMLPGGKVIISKVFDKCLDDKVMVRKAALQFIVGIFKFSPKWMTNESLMLFGKHCRDPALSIRKEMLGCVTDLILHFPEHEPLMELWIEEIVPLIKDREIRVQENALQIFTQTILSKITVFQNTKTPEHKLPWKLLDKIAKQNKRCFLQTACSLWSENGSFNKSLITTLKSHVGTSNDGPVWVFLSCISEYFDIENPDFVMDYYMDVFPKETADKNTLYLALLTLSNSWQKLTEKRKEILQKEMYERLRTFSVDPTFVGLIVEIVAGITVYIAENELAGKKEVDKLGTEMISECETHLEICLKDKNKNCKHCINILALLGTLISICPDKINQATFSLLYKFLMGFRKSSGSRFEREMYAVTVITLSKMALQNDQCARTLVPGLANLLSYSSDPVVLNNVIVAIADIGESYANLIEPLIPSICVCLKSKNQNLKEITLVLLVELLQEDYLKARGAIIFHLLTMVNDSNSWLVNIVKYYFTNSLIARNPYKMYELLLPALFHFNNYTDHPDYPRLEMTDAEWEAFDLSGLENHSERMNIYQFMLSNVPDMCKMKCSHFICTVILNGVADNIISIKTNNGEQLLFDALSVLLTKEIKIEYNDLVNEKNEDGEDNDAHKQNILYKLGKQVFTAAQKKEIIETIVPICCKLKKKLIVENKKLLPYLRKFVRELVKDYKEEINEIFKADKQFGVEIMHELDKMVENEVEEEEEEEEEREDNINNNNNDDMDDGNSGKPNEKNAEPENLNLGSKKKGENQNFNERKTLPTMSDKRCKQRTLSLPNYLSHSNFDVRVEVERLNLNSPALQALLSPRKKQSLTKSPSTKEVFVCLEKLKPEVLQLHLNGKPGVKEEEVQNATDLFPRKKLHFEQRSQKNSLDSNTVREETCEKSKIITKKVSVKLEKIGEKRTEILSNREEEKNMEKDIKNILLPPPTKKIHKKHRKKITNSKSNHSTNTTPVVEGKKELLTSTPLVTYENSDFEMDISSVMEATN